MEILQKIIAPVYFIFGGILIFLAYTIFRDNPKHRTNRTTSMMLFFAALGPIFLALGAIVKPVASAQAPFEESMVYNLFYIWELFFPSFLLFSWIYPVERVPVAKRRRLKYLIFFPHLFHLLLVMVFRNPERLLQIFDFESGEGFLSLVMEPLSALMKWVVLGFSLLLSSEKTLFAIINFIYVGLALYNIIRGRMLIENAQVRRQSTILAGGIAVAVGVYISIFTIPDLFNIDISNELKSIGTILLLLVGGGSIGWAIIRHQFLDVRFIFRQSLVYTISSGILVGLYILVVGQADRMITSAFGAQTNLVNIAFIILALILYKPIINRLDDLIQKIFIRSRTDHRNILEQLSKRLISVFNPEKVRETIDHAMRTTLLVRRLYFVQYDDPLSEYVLLASEDFPNRIIIDRDDHLLGAIGQLDTPTLIDRLDEYRQDSQLSGALIKRRIQLILPLKDADHLLGFLALTEKATGYGYNTEDIITLGVISNQLVTVLTNARLYADSLEKQRLDEEMAMARQIQLDLLPEKPPSSDIFDISAYSMPSLTIGGDFYDFIRSNDGNLTMVIADASGKGMPAALLVAQIQAMLHSEIGNRNDLPKILYNINKHVAETTSPEKYATLFFGQYNPNTGEFIYVNAGHNYPILVKSDGSHVLLKKGGMLIGAFAGVEYEKDSITLDKDDLLLLYTDGLSEAMNSADEEFGDQRIIDYLVKQRSCGADDIINGVMAEVQAFDSSSPPRDDTTLIALKVKRGMPDA
jgi:phosphoserine phosphatase RsbU/P